MALSPPCTARPPRGVGLPMLLLISFLLLLLSPQASAIEVAPTFSPRLPQQCPGNEGAVSCESCASGGAINSVQGVARLNRHGDAITTNLGFYDLYTCEPVRGSAKPGGVGGKVKCGMRLNLGFPLPEAKSEYDNVNYVDSLLYFIVAGAFISIVSFFFFLSLFTGRYLCCCCSPSTSGRHCFCCSTLPKRPSDLAAAGAVPDPEAGEKGSVNGKDDDDNDDGGGLVFTPDNDSGPSAQAHSHGHFTTPPPRRRVVPGGGLVCCCRSFPTLANDAPYRPTGDTSCCCGCLGYRPDPAAPAGLAYPPRERWAARALAWLFVVSVGVCAVLVAAVGSQRMEGNLITVTESPGPAARMVGALAMPLADAVTGPSASILSRFVTDTEAGVRKTLRWEDLLDVAACIEASLPLIGMADSPAEAVNTMGEVQRALEAALAMTVDAAETGELPVLASSISELQSSNASLEREMRVPEHWLVAAIRAHARAPEAAAAAIAAAHPDADALAEVVTEASAYSFLPSPSTARLLSPAAAASLRSLQDAAPARELLNRVRAWGASHGVDHEADGKSTKKGSFGPGRSASTASLLRAASATARDSTSAHTPSTALAASPRAPSSLARTPLVVWVRTVLSLASSARSLLSTHKTSLAPPLLTLARAALSLPAPLAALAEARAAAAPAAAPLAARLATIAAEKRHPAAAEYTRVLALLPAVLSDEAGAAVGERADVEREAAAGKLEAEARRLRALLKDVYGDGVTGSGAEAVETVRLWDTYAAGMRGVVDAVLPTISRTGPTRSPSTPRLRAGEPEYALLHYPPLYSVLSSTGSALEQLPPPAAAAPAVSAARLANKLISTATTDPTARDGGLQKHRLSPLLAQTAALAAAVEPIKTRSSLFGGDVSGNLTAILAALSCAAKASELVGSFNDTFALVPDQVRTLLDDAARGDAMVGQYSEALTAAESGYAVARAAVLALDVTEAEEGATRVASQMSEAVFGERLEGHDGAEAGVNVLGAATSLGKNHRTLKNVFENVLPRINATYTHLYWQLLAPNPAAVAAVSNDAEPLPWGVAALPAFLKALALAANATNGGGASSNSSSPSAPTAAGAPIAPEATLRTTHAASVRSGLGALAAHLPAMLRALRRAEMAAVPTATLGMCVGFAPGPCSRSSECLRAPSRCYGLGKRKCAVRLSSGEVGFSRTRHCLRDTDCADVPDNDGLGCPGGVEDVSVLQEGLGALARSAAALRSSRETGTLAAAVARAASKVLAAPGAPGTDDGDDAQQTESSAVADKDRVTDRNWRRLKALSTLFGDPAEAAALVSSLPPAAPAPAAAVDQVFMLDALGGSSLKAAPAFNLPIPFPVPFPLPPVVVPPTPPPTPDNPNPTPPPPIIPLPPLPDFGIPSLPIPGLPGGGGDVEWPTIPDIPLPFPSFPPIDLTDPEKIVDLIKDVVDDVGVIGNVTEIIDKIGEIIDIDKIIDAIGDVDGIIDHLPIGPIISWQEQLFAKFRESLQGNTLTLLRQFVALIKAVDECLPTFTSALNSTMPQEPGQPAEAVEGLGDSVDGLAHCLDAKQNLIKIGIAIKNTRIFREASKWLRRYRPSLINTAGPVHFFAVLLDAFATVSPADPERSTLLRDSSGKSYTDGRMCVTADCLAATVVELEQGSVLAASDGAIPIPFSRRSLVTFPLILPGVAAVLLLLASLLGGCCGGGGAGCCSSGFGDKAARRLSDLSLLLMFFVLFLGGLYALSLLFPLAIVTADTCASADNLLHRMLKEELSAFCRIPHGPSWASLTSAQRRNVEDCEVDVLDSPIRFNTLALARALAKPGQCSPPAAGSKAAVPVRGGVTAGEGGLVESMPPRKEASAGSESDEEEGAEESGGTDNEYVDEVSRVLAQLRTVVQSLPDRYITSAIGDPNHPYLSAVKGVWALTLHAATARLTEAAGHAFDDIAAIAGCHALSESYTAVRDPFCCGAGSNLFLVGLGWVLLLAATAACGVPAGLLGRKRFPRYPWGPMHKAHAKGVGGALEGEEDGMEELHDPAAGAGAGAGGGAGAGEGGQGEGWVVEAAEGEDSGSMSDDAPAGVTGLGVNVDVDNDDDDSGLSNLVLGSADFTATASEAPRSEAHQGLKHGQQQGQQGSEGYMISEVQPSSGSHTLTDAHVQAGGADIEMAPLPRPVITPAAGAFKPTPYAPTPSPSNSELSESHSLYPYLRDFVPPGPAPDSRAVTPSLYLGPPPPPLRTPSLSGETAHTARSGTGAGAAGNEAAPHAYLSHTSSYASAAGMDSVAASGVGQRPGSASASGRPGADSHATGGGHRRSGSGTSSSAYLSPQSHYGMGGFHGSARSPHSLSPAPAPGVSTAASPTPAEPTRGTRSTQGHRRSGSGSGLGSGHKASGGGFGSRSLGAPLGPRGRGAGAGAGGRLPTFQEEENAGEEERDADDDMV